MNKPPLKISYQKVECSLDEEQEILDEIFDVLFSFILKNDKATQFEIVKGLTITSV